MTNDSLRYATMFSLGREGDHDDRPHVSVHREYGSTMYPIPPWVVVDVEPRRGAVHESRETFEKQADALARGWERLAKLRLTPP